MFSYFKNYKKLQINIFLCSCTRSEVVLPRPQAASATQRIDFVSEMTNQTNITCCLSALTDSSLA
jgi:hypothetical protein